MISRGVLFARAGVFHAVDRLTGQGQWTFRTGGMILKPATDHQPGQYRRSICSLGLGENYISSPHLSRGVFAALAEGCDATAEELATKLDQPWCNADLYYMEKVSSILRKLDIKPYRMEPWASQDETISCAGPTPESYACPGCTSARSWSQ